jgi:hypothetical protein
LEKKDAGFEQTRQYCTELVASLGTLDLLPTKSGLPTEGRA